MIVYFPIPEAGLWNPEVSVLMDRVEEELDIVVSHAGPDRGSPGLRDAVAAVRFMGCRRAVVVTPESVALPTAELEESASLGVELTVVRSAAMRIREVARSYRSACGAQVEAA